MPAGAFGRITKLFLGAALMIAGIAQHAAAATYNNISTVADSRANTSLPIFITGDSLEFDSEESAIRGTGNVILRHDQTSIFADSVLIDTDDGDIAAEGNVLVLDASGSIYTDRVFYNFRTKDAYTENATVVSPPWILHGKKLKKEGNRMELENPMFTTCDKEKPHYRMEASMIYLYEDEKIETWHTVIYLGAIPVFYFPYYTQSLKNSKSPFEFRVGHNDYTGWYVYTKYNMYFDYFNEGALGVDYMEKKGYRYSTDWKYGFGRHSYGAFSGFYHEEKDTHRKRWSVSHSHNQTFSQNTRFVSRIETVSDQDLSRDFLETNVDTYEHKLYAFFSTGFANQSLNITASDTETLNQDTNRYETSSRVLPNVYYSMTSTNILPFTYYRHTMYFNRNLLKAEQDYSRTGSVSPGLNVAFPQMTLFTLSGAVNAVSNWTDPSEKDDSRGDFLHNVNASETLAVNFLPSGRLRLNLTHSVARQLNKAESLPHTGLVSNSLSGNLYAGMDLLVLSASTSYNMLLDREELRLGKDVERLSPMLLSASLNHEEYYLSATGSYVFLANAMKSLSMTLTITDALKSLWAVSATTTFVNNLIDGAGYEQLNARDTVYLNTNMSYAFTEEFRVTAARWYDLIDKTLKEHRYSLTWFLHCWQADLSWSKRQDNVEEIFFSVYISAVPQYRLDKPATAAPNYNLQFGN